MSGTCSITDTIFATVRRLAKERILADFDEKDVRVNLWDITGEAIRDMVHKGVLTKGVAEHIGTGAVTEKLKNALRRTRKNQSVLDEFLQKLGNRVIGTKGEFDSDVMRNQAIALSVVLESVKGEVDKAGNEGLRVEQIGSHGGAIPNLPAHRLAATIGRKILYAQGFRLTKKTNRKGRAITSPAQVELAYYSVGLRHLQNLEKNGFLSIEKDKPTIKDYLRGRESRRKHGEEAIIYDVPAVILNPEAFGIDMKNIANDPAMEYFTNQANARLEDTDMDTMLGALRAINLVSDPEHVTFPNGEYRNADAYVPGDTVEDARSFLEETPHHIDPDVESFIGLLADKVKKGTSSASRWIANNIVTGRVHKNLFGVERDNSFVSDQASLTGRNLSRTAPIDDLVEYFDMFRGQKDLIMTLFGGRNGRLYYNNSVLNSHGSKLMRHLISSAPTELKVGSDEYIYHLDKVARVFADGKNRDAVIESAQALLGEDYGTPKAADISEAIREFENFQQAKTAERKITYIKRMSQYFPSLDFAELLTAVKAAKELRDGRGADSITTTFMSVSDATASGGQLTLQQASGIEEETSNLLRDMGILNGLEPQKKKVRDIYELLEKELQAFVADEKPDIAADVDSADVEFFKKMINQTREVLYGGKYRNISKDPTMVLIYGQSRGGAITQLSKVMTDKLIEALKSNNPKPALELLNTLTRDGTQYTIDDINKLKIDQKAKEAFRKLFADSRYPEFLYDSLTQSVTNRYLSDYQERAKSIYSLVEEYLGPDADFRVYPADTVIDGELGEDAAYFRSLDDLKERGLPMTKVYEVASEVEGTTVLNRVDRLAQTVMNVSFIHGVDTSNLYRAISKAFRTVPKKYHSNVVVVHDEVRTNAYMARAIEQAYIEANRDAAFHYDIHDQVLRAFEMYYKGDVNSIPEYTELRKQVDASLQTKRQLLTEQYNDQTTAVIGDEIDFEGLRDVTNNAAKSRGTGSAKPKEAPSKPYETVEQELAVEERRRELQEGFEQTPEAVLTYDIETTGSNPARDNILQIAWKRANGAVNKLHASLDQETAEKYLKKFKNHEIGDSDLYAQIEAAYNEDPTMATWNARDDVKPLDELLQTFRADVATAPIVVSFNGKAFDDLFTGVTSTHDIRRLANNLDEFTNVKGRLQDFVDMTQAHDADVDVLATEKLAQRLSKGPVTLRPRQGDKGSEVQYVSQALNSLAEGSPIIQEFLENSPEISIAEGESSKYIVQDGQETIQVSGLKPETQREVEHEIIHSHTAVLFEQSADALTAAMNRNLNYLRKTAEKIREDLQKNPQAFGDFSNRLSLALISNDPNTRAAELVAYLATEPDLAEAVYKKYGASGSTLKRLVGQIVEAVRTLIKGKNVTDTDLAAADIDPEVLHNALHYTIRTGRSMRKDKAKWQQMLDSLDLSLNFTPQQGRTNPVSQREDLIIDPDSPVSRINEAVLRYFNNPIIRKGTTLGQNLDTYLRIKMPVYRRAIVRGKQVFNDSETLQQIYQTVTNNNINRELKNQVLSLFASARADKNELISAELGKYRKVLAKMSEEEVAAVYDFTQKMPLHDYFVNEVKMKNLNKSLKKAEAELTEKGLKEALQGLVDLNVHDRVSKGTFYNMKEVMRRFNRKHEAAARKWVALKSIQELGPKRFEAMLKNTELMELLRDTTLAHAHLAQHPSLEGMSTRDNLLVEEWDDQIALQVVRLEDLNGIIGGANEEGWKVATQPTKDRPGVVYRKVIDQTFQEGVFTDLRLASSDLVVPKGMAGMKGVVKVGNEYKFIMPRADKEKIGLIKDPSQALVRSMAHSLTVKETDAIRELVMREETFWDVDEKGWDLLDSVIKDPARDNPWFIGAPDNFEYNKLPRQIRAKYMLVPEKQLSNVGGINSLDTRVKLVRKDIAHWLIGDKRKSLSNNVAVQWGLRITKDILASTKIGMVILNPAKIGADNISNISYLQVMGVDPLYIQKMYRKISRDYHSYMQLKNKLTNAMVRSYANPEKYGKKIEDMKKELKGHPANGFVERGFLNSLGSNLVMNTSDPSSGFKDDIDTVLKAIFQENKGANNKVGKFLMKFSNWSVGMEDYLETFSKVFGKVPSLQVLRTGIEQMAERIDQIKSEDDVITYLHQYLNSPDSEFVKLGSQLTDLTDVMAKETYYQFLVENGKSPKEAEVEVIDSFPDYKESLPTRVKQLSDVGIIMFPTYWMRIQRAIYRMAKNRPASLGTELMIEDLMGTDLPQIWDQNIIKKAESSFGIFHLPWSHIGLGSIFPTRVW